MKPDPATPAVVAYVRKRWPGGFVPRALIRRELQVQGSALPLRTLDRALARAVKTGELEKVTSHEGGAYYCLPSTARAIPVWVESLVRDPFRAVPSPDTSRPERGARRRQEWSARKGVHDLRYDFENDRWYNCVACGDVNGRYEPCRLPGRALRSVRVHPPTSGPQPRDPAPSSRARS